MCCFASRRASESPFGCAERAGRYMEVVGCKTEAGSCTLRPGPGAMLFHGISGDHIQGIMEEMERRSKTESRLAKGMQLNGRESVRAAVDPCWSGTLIVASYNDHRGAVHAQGNAHVFSLRGGKSTRRIYQAAF